MDAFYGHPVTESRAQRVSAVERVLFGDPPLAHMLLVVAGDDRAIGLLDVER